MVSLKEARMAKFLTIEELAAKAGVSTTTIVRAERGETIWRLAAMKKIADALGLDPSEIDEFVASARAIARGRDGRTGAS
jgi:transcriptional regulator with XRE-family HTH domain